MTAFRIVLAATVAAALSAGSLGAQSSGPAIYRTKCASCHDGDGTARAPGYVSLSGMSPRAILQALTNGAMRTVVPDLSDADRKAVAEFLSRRSLTPTPLPPQAYCASRPSAPPPLSPADWSGWSGSPNGTGWRTEAQAGLTASHLPGLELRWAFGFAGGSLTRSQPSLAGDQLIVGSQFGEVYSLDPITGCVQWVQETDASIKGVVAIAPPGRAGKRLAVAAGLTGIVTALDLQTGAVQWATRVGDHPATVITGSPVIHAGVVYVPLSSMEVVLAGNPLYRCCTSSGGAVAVNLETGKIVWRHRVLGEPREVGKNDKGTVLLAPAGAPVWSSPTVDPKRGLLYLGTGESYTHPAGDRSDAILALDLKTGKLAWAFQATEQDAWNMACTSRTNRENCPAPAGHDVDFGQAPMIVSLEGGRDLLVAGQKLGVVYALDPDRKGAVVWTAKAGRGGALGGVHWGVAAGEGKVFAPISDRVTGADPAGEARPGLHAFDLKTGAPAWSFAAPPCGGRASCFAAFSSAPVVIPGAVLTGGLDGHLRAFAVDDGRVLWDFDTVRDFETVNGVPARGGAIDGPGPTVANGMVYLSSGYALFGQMGGNVLLAFGVRKP
jgi:polyvinyl alcohol dehydrogenase (cytochrome)